MCWSVLRLIWYPAMLLLPIPAAPRHLPPFSCNFISTSVGRFLVHPRNRCFLSRIRRKPMAQRLQAPSLSSNTVSETSSSHIVEDNDLLIVGPGVLGRMVAEKWKQDYPDCWIAGQTMTVDHHDELIELGINPSLKGTTPNRQYANIIFCAPPRTADYPADVKLATSNWNGRGSFLFTSSTAVYDCNDNGLCDEDCPVVPIGKIPRVDVLLKAEGTVLEAGGCVLRLAGLYKVDRGAHVYWIEKGVVDTRPDCIVNLIHYEDAASLAAAIMKRRFRGQIFLGCDNHPLSRQEIMDCVNLSGKYNKKFQAFTGKLFSQLSIEFAHEQFSRISSSTSYGVDINGIVLGFGLVCVYLLVYWATTYFGPLISFITIGIGAECSAMIK